MYKIAFLFLISVSGLYLNAQSNLDSLWSIWQDESQPDSSRLNAINRFAWEGYLFSQPDSAFYFAQLQYDFAQSKGLKVQMRKALNSQGVSFQIRGDYAKALSYSRKCVDLAEELDDKKGLSGSFNNLGLIYLNQGIYPKSLEYFQKSLAIKKEIGDKKGMSSSFNNIGRIYLDQVDYTQALKYFQESLKTAEERGDIDGMASSMVNMGICYDEQGNNDQGRVYYEKGLTKYEEIGNKSGMANALANLGMVDIEEGNFSRALEYFQRGLAIENEVGNKSGIANMLNRIGNLYRAQANYSKARDYCLRGLKMAEEIGTLPAQIVACECLYNYYKTLGKGNQALIYLEKIQVLNDSLNAEETAKKLQQMEFAKQVLADSIKMEEDKLQVKLAHEEEVRKNNRTKNIILISGIFALLLAGGFYSRWRYVRKAKGIIEKEKDRSENLLLNILPAEIAEELKEKGRADARDFDLVSILFTDFKGFTEQSAKLSAAELVNEINHCFKAFDGIIEKYGIEKIKTIGDAYMAAGGLPAPTENSVKNTVLAALEMQRFIEERRAENILAGKPSFEMRAGIHTGPVVAGIVGVKKFQYDIWGDTVNTASRMESSGAVGKVNISQATYELLKDDPELLFESRGKIEAKGKGEMDMYFVSKA